MRYIFSLIAACLVFGARPAVLAQATITWGIPTAFSGTTDILTTGTFVAAASAFNSARTVNGVSFAAFNGTSSITYTGTHASYGTGVNSGNSAYNDILNTGFYSPNGGSATLTLSGLTSGQQYRVQLWTPSWDLTWATTYSSGYQVAMGNTATVPTYVSGSFTATGPSQSITYQSSTNTYGLIGAVSLYNVTAIPEPSTYAALFGAAALTLAAWRKRRRSA